MTRSLCILGAATAAGLAAALPAPGAASPFPRDVHAFLVEGPHGEMLARWNANRQVPVASLTKLMTVNIALRHLRPQQAITVPAGVSVGQSSIGLKAGDILTVRQLLEGAFVPSANDAADTLAYAASGGDSFSQFAARMNARAHALGFRHTHFDRPDGLSTGDQSSAADITRLAQLDMRSPIVRSIVRLRSVTLPTGTFLARNNLLTTFPGVFGVKTGHTDAAGWCEVAAVRRNGVTIYVTVLGAPTESARDADLAQLLTWGLSRYRPAVVVDPHRVYAKVETQYGRPPVPLVGARQVVRPLRAGKPVVERVVTDAPPSLPVRAGEPLGRIEVVQDGRVLARSTLVAAHLESGPGVFGRIGWYLGEAAHRLWSWL